MIVPDKAKRPFGDRRRAILLLAAVTAAGLLLRIGLSGYSMWYDEFASVAFAERPLRLLWSDWMVRETNPPLFYSLLHGWINAFGHSLVALRMMPVLLGTIGIALVAAIAWIASGRRAAVLAGALTAISAQHVYYSHTVRAYILAFDGVALALFGLVIVITGERNRRAGLACYVAGSAIAIYAHTTMFLWLPAAMLGLCAAAWRDIWVDRGHLFRQLIFASLLILALSAWWLRITVLQLQVSRGNIEWIAALGPADALQLMIQTMFLSRGESFWPSAVSLLCVFAAV
ncbi:MAG: glycosyltransferase family 39 protein, partial [Rhizorhabdus sp.]